MTPIDGQPILTAAQMREAEAAAAPDGEALYGLMERAGAGVADAVRRVAAGAPVLVLCGPGNNGGDGYVAARVLREQGIEVRVAALTPPRTALARRAAKGWNGPVAHYTTGDQTDRRRPAWDRRPPPAAPILVDALFGTGGREDYAREPWLAKVRPLFEKARYKIAVDLPLGLSAAGQSAPPIEFANAQLTLAIGALKPIHVLAETRAACGQVRIVDLGLDLAEARVRVIERPPARPPGIETHKYTRGMVGVVAGAMPGAARLAATAAARAGAGYVAIYGDAPGGPAALVHRELDEAALSDERLDAVVIGPGLGRDERARHWLEWLIRKTDHHLVIDGDALRLLDPEWLDYRTSVVLTPHAGEHRALIAHLGRRLVVKGDPFGTSTAQIKALAHGAHVMVAKGSTTVIADYATAIVAPGGNPWLSTAGTGDVLAGAIGAMVASRRHQPWPLAEAAAAGVWLHSEAARRLGAGFIADDLARELSAARAGL